MAKVEMAKNIHFIQDFFAVKGYIFALVKYKELQEGKTMAISLPF